MTPRPVTRRDNRARAASASASTSAGAAVVPEWEDAELLRLVAALRDRIQAR